MKMKDTHRIFFIATLACQLCLQACAQPSTNIATEVKIYPIIQVFVGWNPQDANYYEFHQNNYKFYKHAPFPEMLSSAQDPAGNWGNPADGLQLSLRFRHGEYLLGEPVNAVVILRNVAASSRRIILCQDEEEFEYVLHQGTNTVITKYPPNRPRLDTPLPYKLEPNTETVQVIYLNRHCDLKQPGQYSLELQRTIHASDGYGPTNIISGTATFEIVKEYSPAETAARNLEAEEWKKIQGTNQPVFLPSKRN
jgi:hypothetical protein